MEFDFQNEIKVSQLMDITLQIKLWIKQHIKELLVVFFAGMLLYSFMGMHFLTNGDGVVIGLHFKPGSEGRDLGRFGINYVDILFGRVISPVFMIIFCVVIYSFINIIVAKIFHYDDSSFIKIVAGLLLMLMPCTSNTFTYHYCSAPYTISFFCAVAAVFLLIYTRSIFSIVISVLLVAASLSLYQAYLSVTCALVVVYLICHFLGIIPTKLKDGGNGNRGVFLFIAKAAVTVGCGVLLYLLLLKLSHAPLTSNRGFDKIGQLDFRTLPSLIYASYYNFFQDFFGTKLLNNAWGFRRVLNILLFLFSACAFVFIVIKNKIHKNLFGLLFAIVLVAVMPLAVELTTIIAPGVSHYKSAGIITVPAIVTIYWLALMLLRRMCIEIENEHFVLSKITATVFSLVFAGLFWNLTLFTYAQENVLYINKMRSVAICNDVKTALIANEMLEPQEKMTLLIGGTAANGNYPFPYPQLQNIVKGTLSAKGLVWEGGYLTQTGYWNIARNYIGGGYYNIPSLEEYNEIMNSSEYKQMGIFPAKDSLKKINGICVVKLAED